MGLVTDIGVRPALNQVPAFGYSGALSTYTGAVFPKFPQYRDSDRRRAGPDSDQCPVLLSALREASICLMRHQSDDQLSTHPPGVNLHGDSSYFFKVGFLIEFTFFSETRGQNSESIRLGQWRT